MRQGGLPIKTAMTPGKHSLWGRGRGTNTISPRSSNRGKNGTRFRCIQFSERKAFDLTDTFS